MRSDTITRREALRRSALLLGGAISAPAVAGVLSGCGGDVGERGAAALKVLTREQNALVASIADHIIPETDTPGASAAHVDAFIDEMLSAYYPEAERELFLAGLGRVDERAEEAHGSRFLDCTHEQQRALLVQLDRESFEPAPEAADEPPDVDVRERTDASGSPLPAESEADTVQWIHGERQGRETSDTPFFRTMKELTLLGYYTSEVGATVELRHEAIPGRYEACVPFAEIGRTWAV